LYLNKRVVFKEFIYISVDNDKKNARSVENSKNKGAFLKSLNQCFMWITKGTGVDNNRVFNKKVFFS
jgi:hypothetical protein